jgi:hypothetical protein
MRSLSSKFQTRISRLAARQTLCCSWCLVPRVLCDRWVRGPGNRWTESDGECQYRGVITRAVVTMVEFDNRLRDVADSWMDFHGVPSRNLDKVCQWLSGRTVGDELYAIRVVQLFYLLVDPWMERQWSGKYDGFIPNASWIASTGDGTRTGDIADQLAFKARER